MNHGDQIIFCFLCWFFSKMIILLPVLSLECGSLNPPDIVFLDPEKYQITEHKSINDQINSQPNQLLSFKPITSGGINAKSEGATYQEVEYPCWDGNYDRRVLDAIFFFLSLLTCFHFRLTFSCWRMSQLIHVPKKLTTENAWTPNQLLWHQELRVQKLSSASSSLTLLKYVTC